MDGGNQPKPDQELRDKVNEKRDKYGKPKKIIKLGAGKLKLPPI